MPKPEPIIVSYSELDTFRQCPLKHYISYTQRWTKPPKPDSALAKGSLWHMIMEIHYRVIRDHQTGNGGKAVPVREEKDVLAEAYAQIRPILWDETLGVYKNDVCELIDWMYQGHVDQWGIDRDWKILGVEHQIITPLRDARGRKSRYHLKAKMDLLVQQRSDGGLWVVDHKSGANLPTQMDLEIDDQFGLYTWAMREVGRPVVGSLHNANRTQRNKSPMALDIRMSRTYLNRGEKELTNLALDAYYAARAAHPPKSMEPARYSSPDPRSCGWKCDFKEVHLIARTGRSLAETLVEYGFRIDRTRH
jgi:PD-(D/E)XK nuclease superfamily